MNDIKVILNKFNKHLPKYGSVKLIYQDNKLIDLVIEERLRVK